MLSLEEFEKNFWNKLSLKERNFAFYVSLYDLSSFEAGEDIDLINKTSKFKEKLARRLLKVNRVLFRKNFPDNELFHRWVDTDYLCRYILMIELKNNGIPVDQTDSSFPDISLKGKRGVIEIKRFFSGSNFCDEVDDTIKKINKSQKGKRYILLVLIPIVPLLDSWIVRKSVKKYVKKLLKIAYIVEKCIGVQIEKGKRISVIIKDVDRKGKEWSFELISLEFRKVIEREKRRR